MKRNLQSYKSDSLLVFADFLLQLTLRQLVIFFFNDIEIRFSFNFSAIILNMIIITVILSSHILLLLAGGESIFIVLLLCFSLVVSYQERTAKSSCVLCKRDLSSDFLSFLSATNDQRPLQGIAQSRRPIVGRFYFDER